MRSRKTTRRYKRRRRRQKAKVGLAPERTELLTIRGASHLGFADDTESLIAVGLMDLIAHEIDPRRQLSISRECVRTFFDIHLQGAGKNTLCNSQQYPEIMVNRIGVDQL